MLFLAGGSGSWTGERTLSKIGSGELQGLLRDDTWKPETTICGVAVGFCMLLLLLTVVLLSTTLAIVLPHNPITTQELSVGLWQQDGAITDSGFELEVSFSRSMIFVWRAARTDCMVAKFATCDIPEF